MIEQTGREQWVLDYLGRNGTASVVDTAFHDAFAEKFKVWQKPTNYGAQPSPIAMRVLKRLYDIPLIRRSRVGLPGSGPEFPNWVYVYTPAIANANKRLGSAMYNYPFFNLRFMRDLNDEQRLEIFKSNDVLPTDWSDDLTHSQQRMLLGKLCSKTGGEGLWDQLNAKLVTSCRSVEGSENG